jgi:hypothetical protein
MNCLRLKSLYGPHILLVSGVDLEAAPKAEADVERTLPGPVLLTRSRLISECAGGSFAPPIGRY